MTDTVSASTDTPAPGSGATASAALCSGPTPCLVCRLKQLALATDAKARFSSRPFGLNLLGIRRAKVVSNVFDDRLALFFALPSEESKQALLNHGIEADLIADINAAAQKLDGRDAPWRSVRLVACSAVPGTDGGARTGHWVLALVPITTDPGLVRLKDSQDKQEADVKAELAKIDMALTALRSAKEKLALTLPVVKSAGEALAKLPLPRKGQPETPERKAAATELAAQQKLVDDIRSALNGATALFPKTLTEAALQMRIDDKLAEQAKLRAEKDQKLLKLIADWEPDAKATLDQLGAFDYRYAFRNENGDFEGDSHAYFPLGHQSEFFKLYLHHWNRDSAAPALTVGMYLADRVLSGRVLKKDFDDLVDDTGNRRAEVVQASVTQAMQAHAKQCTDRMLEVKAEQATALQQFKAGRSVERARLSDAKDRKAFDAETVRLDKALKDEHQLARTTLIATQAEEKLRLQQPLVDARREALDLVGTRRCQSGAPAGAWVMATCDLVAPDGHRSPLPDDARFRILQAPGRVLSGREIRLQYRHLAGKPGTKSDFAGLEITEHEAMPDQPAFPVGSHVMRQPPVYEAAGKSWPVADDDIVIVRASAGGTNVHRGHGVRPADSGSVSAGGENANRVGNWSTGCQVVPYFDDFNLFILLCGLSKRVLCTPAGRNCTRITLGTPATPDSFVWTHALVSPASLAGFGPQMSQLQNADKALKKQADEAGKALASDTEAWFKANPGIPRPKETGERLPSRLDQLNKVLQAAQAREDTLSSSAGDGGMAPALALARSEREARQQDLAMLQSKIDAVKDLESQRAATRETLAVLAPHDNICSYQEADEWLSAVQQGLAAQLTDAARWPATSAQRLASEQALAGLPALHQKARSEAHTRSVMMHHDWLRHCDLAHSHPLSGAMGCTAAPDGHACKACGVRFDYTLIELTEANATAGLDSLAELESEFTRKSPGGADAHTMWQGFGT